jgi:hypothetical protein
LVEFAWPAGLIATKHSLFPSSSRDILKYGVTSGFYTCREAHGPTQHMPGAI